MVAVVGDMMHMLRLPLLMCLLLAHTYAARFEFDPLLPLNTAIQTAESVGVVFTTICRNEAVNFRANLPLWLKVIDYYVFMMDERNSDDSVEVITSVLQGKALGYKIISHKFEGFGHARTSSLTAAWKHFPQASHVFIADPDWRPKIDTLSKAHLVHNAHVFRMVIYDRNGVTFRAVDWLLRHREGLKMKYALHEVLDIDEYSVAIIPWQAEEIELPGTWHDKAGHGHSRSLKRYEFDLDLLYRDLADYNGVDPHLNYYLAVTHDAYASNLAVELANKTQGANSYSAEVEYHRKMSLGNATLRTLEPYPLEFLEQRWGAQFIIGNAYGQQESIYYNHIKAICWYSMCRDFGPGQTECLRTLVEFLYTLGDLGAAVSYAYDLVRVVPTKRIMLNSRQELDCLAPFLASSILGESLYRDIMQRSISSAPATGLSNLAKYILHLRTLTKRPQCSEGHVGQQFTAMVNAPAAHVENAISRALDADHSVAHNSVQEACADKVFQQYIASNKYQSYDCDELRTLIAQAHKCVDLTTNIPPPSEDLQINVYGEYIGAASLLDVVHHVYMGDASRLLMPKKVYHVLFAEYFNPRMLYNLIGAAARRINSRIKIIVVRNNAADVQLMKDTIAECGSSARTVEFITAPLRDFLASWGSKPELEFDLVEYNAGVNLSPTYMTDLALLHKVLAHDGVIGLTYFTANVHQETLAKLISKQLEEAHVPFSLRAEYLMTQYLEHHGLTNLKKDRALFAFFGGDLDRNMYNTDRRNATKLQSHRVFNQSAITELLTRMQFKAVSWIPSSFAKPFDELDHYEIQKFHSAGLSQESFIETLMPMFRYAVYVSKLTVVVPGRARMEDIISNVDAGNVTVLDRYETLSATFDNADVKAKSGSAVILHFTYYGIPQSMRLVYYVNHVLLPGLASLSTSPKLAAIFKANDAFWSDPAIIKDIDYVDRFANRTLYKLQVCQLFDILEKMNAITFLHDGPTLMPAISVDTPAAKPPITVASSDVLHRTQKKSVEPSKDSYGPQATAEVKNDGEASVLLKEEVALLMSLLSGKVTAMEVAKQLVESASPGIQSSSSLPPPPPPHSSARSVPAIVPAEEQINPTQFFVANMMARVSSIEMPNRQTRADTEKSSRSFSCIDNKNSDMCYKPPSVRKTSFLDIACAKKFDFDIKQLEFIASLNGVRMGMVGQDILPRITNSKNIFSENYDRLAKRYNKNCVSLQQLQDCQPQEKSCRTNYFYFISEEPTMTTESSLIHDAALEQMVVAHAHMAQNDYAVVDVILRPAILSLLSEAALASTIWYDVTNGNAFVAHHDDGLVHDAYARLAAELAASFSSQESFRVVKYYAVALNLQEIHEGPLSRVEVDQLALILWINPTDTSGVLEESKHDGLLIFAQEVNDILSAEGFNIDKDIHPDFFSKNESLDFEQEMPPTSFQQVGRYSNRLTIVGPRLPFRFATVTAQKSEILGFAGSTSVAFVVVLERQK